MILLLCSCSLRDNDYARHLLSVSHSRSHVFCGSKSWCFQTFSTNTPPFTVYSALDIQQETMTTAATEEENNESSGEGVDDQPNILMETQQSSGRSDKMSERARKKESKEESAESASTGSSEGKSGSGGGYSADCSASDQSSDENGDRKDTSSNLSLNVGGLTLHDRAASRSSNSGDDAPSEQNEGGREAEANDNTSASVSKNDGKSVEQNDANSLGIELPMKSPDTIDLESIMRSKTKEERESAAAMQDYQVLPQWNGVRVGHPMDPRIDLRSVTVLQAGVVPGVFQSIEKQQQLQSGLQSEEASAPFSVDNYAQLLEVRKRSSPVRSASKTYVSTLLTISF